MLVSRARPAVVAALLPTWMPEMPSRAATDPLLFTVRLPDASKVERANGVAVGWVDRGLRTGATIIYNFAYLTIADPKVMVNLRVLGS